VFEANFTENKDPGSDRVVLVSTVDRDEDENEFEENQVKNLYCSNRIETSYS